MKALPIGILFSKSHPQFDQSCQEDNGYSFALLINLPNSKPDDDDDLDHRRSITFWLSSFWIDQICWKWLLLLGHLVLLLSVSNLKALVTIENHLKRRDIQPLTSIRSRRIHQNYREYGPSVSLSEFVSLPGHERNQTMQFWRIGSIKEFSFLAIQVLVNVTNLAMALLITYPQQWHPPVQFQGCPRIYDSGLLWYSFFCTHIPESKKGHS